MADDIVELLEDRLYFAVYRAKPRRSKKTLFFSIDNEFEYYNFFLDFGPFNLGWTMKFFELLDQLMSDPKLKNTRICYYCGTSDKVRANATLLITSYMMFRYNKTPEEAYSPFAQQSFTPFHDASPYMCTYKLSILDCLKGMQKAYISGFFDPKTFDINEYERNERVEYGDMSWIVEGKFLAFAGPHDERSHSSDGVVCLTPEDYIQYFKAKGVSMVVRLNSSKYDARKFTRRGIKHVDLQYPDGSNPPASILKEFLEICENEPGAIAVHCKAGLGRTGTCIGAYLIKQYGFTAAEAIGWMRVCRPGSVIGPQQQFLEHIETVFDGKLNDTEESKEDDGYVDLSQGDLLRVRKSLGKIKI